MNKNMENKVAEGQYRVGSHGLIYVLAPHANPRAKIRDDVIYHASCENIGVIFGISIILAKNGNCFESPDSSDKWQYHTVASIMEKWPKVLSDNWLQQLM